MEYLHLKNRYPVFYYHTFEMVESDQQLLIRYDFEIDGLSHFNPEFILPKPAGSGTSGILRVAREAAFSLGMAELISYWKLTCSPRVIVECGSLDSWQVQWWKKLYYNGLGEFFFRNHIDADPDQFMNLISAGNPIEGDPSEAVCSGNLIPVGGGKDSLVTLDLLKEEKAQNHAFVINHVMSAIHSAQAAGYSGERLIVAQRTLDSRMMEFNKQGYLNGHTPFSALAAFACMLTAIVYQKKYICLSNESSANEPTVANSRINHQYSKTFEFEQDFQQYCAHCLTPDILYFSFLRPLSELQISGLFAALPQYHAVFRSCNVGQKEERWCGCCAKCLFVCIMMNAYLPEEKVNQIFGRDLLQDEGMRSLFEEMTGVRDNKPFECVGTRKEVNTAICMSIASMKKSSHEIPLLYREYAETSYYTEYQNSRVSWNDYNEENMLPESFDKILKKRLAEMKE